MLSTQEPPSRSAENQQRTTVDTPSSTTARHNNTSERDVKLGTQSRGGQVCPHNDVVLAFYDAHLTTAYRWRRWQTRCYRAAFQVIQHILLGREFFLHLELGTCLLHKHHKTPAPARMLPLHVIDQKSEGERVKFHLMHPTKDMRLDLAYSWSHHFAQPVANSSAHSAPPLNQPGISMSLSLSPSLSRMAPAITRSTSSWMHTVRGILSGEHYSQSGGFHPDKSRLPEQGKG